jgi:ribosomal protein S18 acetylase RimI-like enzyme
LRSAIEKTWGWDEAFQFNEFNKHLSPDKFEIIYIADSNIGGYCLFEKDDHLWLEMLLIHPDYQHKGIGKSIMKEIQKQSATKNKPLKLSVIKTNPVRLFYEKLDFGVYDVDKAFYQMTWADE